MHSQTFGHRPVSLSGIAASIAAAFTPVLNVLESIGQSRARAELQRMADVYADTRPELAAQLRKAVRGNWYGE